MVKKTIKRSVLFDGLADPAKPCFNNNVQSSIKDADLTKARVPYSFHGKSGVELLALSKEERTRIVKDYINAVDSRIKFGI